VTRKAMPAKKAKETITRSSGNVFADLELPNPEELQLKARLTHLIIDIIEGRNLTPQQAAKALGIKRAEVSKLTQGGFDDFSGGQLLYFLSRLEHRVVITVYENGKPLPRSEIVIAARPAKDEADNRAETVALWEALAEPVEDPEAQRQYAEAHRRNARLDPEATFDVIEEEVQANRNGHSH
jgi:predicted XRE-type DNA-binding protein